MAFHAIATDGLPDFQCPQSADDARTSHQANEQSGERTHDRTEREVLEHAEKAELG